ncbi:DUF4221 family protein [Negadavirga shengliensis]|uniref:DUF4221 family protein n=1 Tax=Negadavirga shengliensis TaxID=1389218 RepID=A0ABV9T185_9BACT
MRYFTFLAITCIILSCQGKNNSHEAYNLLYSVDTIIIESNTRLLDLKRGIWISDLNDEESSINLYNSFNHSIDDVNLDRLEIASNLSFEIEGPDGTGEHVNSFNLLKNGLLFIKSFNKSAIFKTNGQLLKKIDWMNAIDTKGLKYGEIPRNEMAIGNGELNIFGLNYNNRSREVFLDVLSVEKNLVERYDIDAEKSYQNFVLAYDDPKFRTFLDPYVFMSSENNLAIISHQYSNEVFVFNFEGKLLQTVHYEPKMTPKRARDLSGMNITSNEQIQNEYQKLLEQVRFGPPVWDRLKKRYLRLSAKRVFSEIRKEDSLLPEIEDVTVYLSIFDEAFNLISESAIPELNTEFVKYFAKDGKLWVFQNFSDELGFIVIDI